MVAGFDLAARFLAMDSSIMKWRARHGYFPGWQGRREKVGLCNAPYLATRLLLESSVGAAIGRSGVYQLARELNSGGAALRAFYSGNCCGGGTLRVTRFDLLVWCDPILGIDSAYDSRLQ